MAQQPIYGLAMLEELKRHGYALSPGTLYPILHSLENRGYLQQETRVVNGRVRKCYAATETGRQTLADVKEKMAELVDEVLEGHGPEQLPDLFSGDDGTVEDG